MTANHHEHNGADRQRVEELSVLATTRGLDQLTADEEATLASALTKPANQELLGASEQASRMAAVVAAAITSNELPAPSAELRAAVDAELDAALVSPAEVSKNETAEWSRRVNWYAIGALLTICGLLVGLLSPAVQMAREGARRSRQTAVTSPDDIADSDTKLLSEVEQEPKYSTHSAERARPIPPDLNSAPMSVRVRERDAGVDLSGPAPTAMYVPQGATLQTETAPSPVDARGMSGMAPGGGMMSGMAGMSGMPGSRMSAMPGMPATGTSVIRPIGRNPGGVPSQTTTGPSKGIIKLDKKGLTVTGQTLPSPYYLSDNVQYYEPTGPKPGRAEADKELRDNLAQVVRGERLSVDSGEAYAAIRENAFQMVRDEPLSTFSIDVDTASYANVRRFLTAGQLPPKDAVRIEELLNYFSYDYPQPQEKDPFSVNLEVTDCPWRPENRLLRVGLKGREIAKQQRAASNLVFLIDVSGSMQPENKLPLVKTALKMLVQELTEDDHVSIVTYAGDAGLKLPSTNGTEQSRILSTIDSLSAGGSTHGSAGIALAYEQASGYFIRGGTNRVILLTDGDLNVGITDDDALVQLIQQKAKSGVFLTVLGVGDGNLKDSKMEKLADHGNGVYAYLDGVREARKVLVEQISGSLVTIAKDVKLQIEFNPAQVQAYRLVGYENRVLANRDFHDDTKDAGEIGAGHTVTALYELVPTNAPVPVPGEPLKYQPPRVEETPATPIAQSSRELLTLKLRFKHPEADRSELRDYPLTDRGGKFGQSSTDFRFASSVAMFGLVLRDSQYRGSATLAAVEEIATSSLGQDPRGYRTEFVDLVRKAEQLK